MTFGLTRTQPTNKGYTAAIVTAIVGIVASAALTVLVARDTADIAETNFNDNAKDWEGDIQFAIDGYIKSLTAVQAFFQVTNMDIGRENFWQIAETMRRINPGTLDFAPVIRVTKADRAAFEARIRTQGRTNFQIRERDATGRLVAVDERDEYFPTLTAEFPSGTATADGHDAAADPIQRQLLARSRDDNRIVISPPRKLLFGENGFNIWAPVFRFESATDTLEDRRKNLIGYAAVTIRIDEMFGAIPIPSAENPVDLYIVDPDAAPGNRLIYWDPWIGRQALAEIPTEAAFLAGLYWEGKITIGNQRWRMIVTPAVPLGGGFWGLQALSVLAFGMTLTIMLVIYLLVSQRHNLRLGILTSTLRETAAELTLESENRLLAGQEMEKLAEALRKNQERLILATESAHIGIWDLDVESNKLNWDDRMYKLYGIRAQDFNRTYDAWRASLHPEDRARTDAAIKTAIDGIRDFNIEFRVLWPNGEVHDIEAHALVRRAANGHSTKMVGVNFDITERKQAEQTLAESENKFRTILETAADGILLADRYSRKFIEGNHSIAKMLGYSQAELTTIGVDDIHRPEDLSAMHQSYEQLATGEIKIAMDIPVRRKDGSVFFADITVAPLMLAGRQYQVGFFRDVTERRQNAEIITHRARHDSLTGLVNRQVFLEKVNEAINRANRGEKAFAILYLDLDHFKDVNDTLGHPAGDELLRLVADRLRKSLRTTDTVARFGGDEFAVLLTYIGGPDEVGMLATKLMDVVGKPVILEGNSVPITTSVGISLYGTDANDAETLMSHADLALYRAKADGRNMYSFFTEDMDKKVRARVTLIGELRKAIKSNQLFVVYQPQVDDETGVITGVEALVRWQHPERGPLSPANFIEVAESSGLIVDLGDWVLLNVCRQARLWLDSGIDLASISVSINISPLQFKAPLELKANIERILTETGLPPAILELELTEMTLMAAGQSTSNILTDLRKMGIRIAIDDFGTGYSSLAYLIRYPVDRIKIAQEFMLKLTSDPTSKIIVKSTINLAHDLGLKIVAEGVENKEQLDLLKSWNCRQIQGYYYTKPLSAEAITVHLRRGTMMPAIARSTLVISRPPESSPHLPDHF